jgi:hypothetical protein
MAVSVVERCRPISGCRLFGGSNCFLLRGRSVCVESKNVVGYADGL